MAKLWEQYYQLRVITSSEVWTVENDTLQLTFEAVQAFDQKDMVYSSIVIHGVNSESLDFLTGLESGQAQVELIAGYKDHHGLICSGFLAQSIAKREGTAINVLMFVRQSPDTIDSVFVVQTFAKGTTLESAVQEILSELDLTPDWEDPTLKTQTLEQAHAFSGSVWDSLHELSVLYKFSLSVHSKTVVLGNKTPKTGEVVVLSPDSGLIGYPELSIKKTVKAISLLNHRLRVFNYVKISTQTPAFITDIEPENRVLIEKVGKLEAMTIHKVTHKGDTHGQEWKTYIEGVSV